jgi:tetratricopeptide (TPR) repeat protein
MLLSASGLGPAGAPPTAHAAAAVAVSATPAAPEPSAAEQEAAANHYQSGVSFFQSGNYAAARAEFEAAYQLTRYPDLLFNLAKVAEQQSRTDDEVRYLDEYLATSPKDADEVRARLAKIRRPARKQRLPPTAAMILAGGGVAALIIGIGCGGGAIAAARTVGDPANQGQPFSADLLNTQQSGIQLSRAAIAFDVIGGTALAAGGAWIGYWLYKRRDAKPATAGVQTALRPSGLGLAWTGSF